MKIYCKKCPKCNLFYRYQEYYDGVHNFNDSTMLTLHLCLFLRHSLQVNISIITILLCKLSVDFLSAHTAIGRVVAVIESMTGKSLSHNTVLNAYCHFEALSEHKYKFYCIHCGFYPPPPILTFDVNRKAAFSLAGKLFNLLYSK